MTTGEETFLGRWSRRKQEVREQEERPDPETDAAPGEDDSDATVSVTAVEDTPSDDSLADLPDIETLDKDSDFTGFMRDGVPDELRNRALRKLWLSDPIFADLDGLNEYDHDYAAMLREGTEALKRFADAVKSVTEDKPDDAGQPAEAAQPAEPATGEGDEEIPPPPEPDRIAALPAEPDAPEDSADVAGSDIARTDDPTRS